MIVRLSKCALLFGVAFFFTLVVFNNVTDYNSNYQFVRHVLAMDTTFPGNHGMWRALHGDSIYKSFYLGIICWETGTGTLCWWGLVRLLRRCKAPAAVFEQGKSVAVIGLTLGCLLWFLAFVDVGGEWFLMWQSKVWNGQDAAFRMFVMLGMTLIYLGMPEREPGGVAR